MTGVGQVDELFSDFSPRPIGAASLAQVHRARLKATGAIVAVKVQHPNVKPHSTVDTITMEVPPPSLFAPSCCPDWD